MVVGVQIVMFLPFRKTLADSMIPTDLEAIPVVVGRWSSAPAKQGREAMRAARTAWRPIESSDLRLFRCSTQEGSRNFRALRQFMSHGVTCCCVFYSSVLLYNAYQYFIQCILIHYTIYIHTLYNAYQYFIQCILIHQTMRINTFYNAYQYILQCILVHQTMHISTSYNAY